MLEESKQIELSIITPKGSADTQEQLTLRDEIKKQQKTLAILHKKTMQHRDKIQGVTEIKAPNELINRFFENYGDVRFGITAIKTEYIYQNSTLTDKDEYIIVFDLRMQFEKMKTVPSIESVTEIMTAYRNIGKIVIDLVKYLQKKGIYARGHHPLGDENEYHQLLLPPHAVLAGMGEKGRTGLFIDHIFGPLVRLAAITTDLRLKINEPKNRGINAFCHRCQYCVTHCPPRALPDGKYLEGLKLGKPTIFKINGDKCIKYFEKHNGCGKCIFHCILAKPTIEEIAKRVDRIDIWYHRWVLSGELEKLQSAEI